MSEACGEGDDEDVNCAYLLEALPGMFGTQTWCEELKVWHPDATKTKRWLPWLASAPEASGRRPAAVGLPALAKGMLGVGAFRPKYCIVLLSCLVLCYIVLYCIVLYCIVLYCIVLYCIVLYCIE